LSKKPDETPKPNKTKKTYRVGFFFKPVFLNTATSASNADQIFLAYYRPTLL